MRHLLLALVLLFAAAHPLHAEEEPSAEPSAEVAETGEEDGLTVTVTAERSEVTLDTSPRAIEIVDRDDIMTELSRSAPEALHEATGVSVQRTNQGGGSPFIRGMTGNQVLLMADGIRINNSTVRGGPNQYLNTIDPLAIERIELVRGIGSVLYGSDALGGVVNVITRRRTEFQESFGIYGSLLGRTTTAEDEESGAFFLSTNIGENVGFAGTYSSRSFGDVDQGGDLDTFVPSGYDAQDFTGNLDFRFTEDAVLQFGAQYSYAEDVPNFAPNDFQREFDPQKRTLFYSRFIGDFGNPVINVLEATVAYHNQNERRNRTRFDDPALGTPAETTLIDDDNVDTIHGGFKVESGAAENLRLVWGTDFYADDIESERYTINRATGVITPETPNVADGSTFDTLAGYLQAQYQAAEWVRIIPGVRYSNFQAEAEVVNSSGTFQVDYDTDDVTWALHSKLDVAEGHQVTVGIARGFRVPSIDDLTKFGSEDGRFDVPNPDLDPETMISYELGYRRFSERLRVGLYGYYNQLEDLIARRQTTFNGATVNPTTGEPYWANQNIGEATIYGFELDFAYRFNAQFSLNGGVAGTHGEDDDGNPLRRIPPLTGFFAVRYTTPDREFYVEPFLRFADKQVRLSGGDIADSRIPDGGTPGFVTYNVRAGIAPAKNLSLFLAVENITDTLYKYHGSGVYEPGRNFKAGLILKAGTSL